jgi:hypothetical protein
MALKVRYISGCVLYRSSGLSSVGGSRRALIFAIGMRRISSIRVAEKQMA